MEKKVYRCGKVNSGSVFLTLCGHPDGPTFI